MGASHFGLMLRQLRKERGVTLHEVAEATGISVPMLSRMERGERLPSSETLKSMSAYYGTSARLLAEAAGQQHSLNRYRDSLSDEGPQVDMGAVPYEPFTNLHALSLSELTAPDTPVLSSSAPSPSPAAFRAQPISALFEPEAEAPADPVEDATLAAEVAVRQLGRELKRSAQSMSAEERERAREAIRRISETLTAMDSAPWWHGA